MSNDTVSSPVHGLPIAGAGPQQVVGIEIPPDAHPDVIQSDSPFLAPAKDAQKQLFDTWTLLKKHHGEVTDKKKLADVAQGAVEKVLVKADVAGKKLLTNRTTLAAKIDAVVLPKAPDTMGAEIRAYMKTHASAFIEVSNRIQAGDKRTAAAVLTAPAFLSGLDDKKLSILLDLAQRKFCPDEVATIGHLDRAISRLDRSAKQISTTFGPLISKWRGKDDKILKELHGK